MKEIEDLRDKATHMANYKVSLGDIIKSKKYKRKGKGPCNPEELVNNLEHICGSTDAGNDNKELKNVGISIINELLKINKLLPKEHEM